MTIELVAFWEKVDIKPEKENKNEKQKEATILVNGLKIISRFFVPFNVFNLFGWKLFEIR